MTNIELKQVAYFAASEKGLPSDLSSLINSLAYSERNLRLAKGEQIAFAPNPPELRDLTQAVSDAARDVRDLKAAVSEQA